MSTRQGRLRPDRKEDRRTQAAERQKASAEKSPAQRLAELDRTLGQGQGAKRERAMLAKKATR